MKKGTISSLLAGLLLTSLVTPTLAAAPTFKDVGASFAKGEIESLHKSGVITGDDKGNFNPTRSMTREEFAVLLSNAMGLSPNATAAASFTDVDKWARPYVGALVTAQITGGYDSTHFGGRDSITREQLAIFFVKAFGKDDTAKSTNLQTTFTDDTTIHTYAKPYVALSQQGGFINGIAKSDGTFSFNPLGKADRQTVAHLAYQYRQNGGSFKSKIDSIAKSYDVFSKADQALNASTSYSVATNQESILNSKSLADSDETLEYSKNPIAFHDKITIHSPDASGNTVTTLIEQYWQDGKTYARKNDEAWKYVTQATPPDTVLTLLMKNHALAPYLTTTEDADTFTLKGTLTPQQYVAVWKPSTKVDIASFMKNASYTIVVEKTTNRVKSISFVQLQKSGQQDQVNISITHYDNTGPVQVPSDVVSNATA